jgi:hypothetical protein
LMMLTVVFMLLLLSVRILPPAHFPLYIVTPSAVM